MQNASLEIAWARVVLEGHTIAGEVVMPFFTREFEGFDINQPQDWEVAESLVQSGRARAANRASGAVRAGRRTMTTLLPSLFPPSEFERVRASCGDAPVRMALIADMCRANTLVAVKRAGSGHLGTSFSALDLLVWLYHEVLDTLRVGLDSPDRDIYFSSKGHDVPALYSVLHSLGVIATDRLLRLRRLGGLDGHPGRPHPRRRGQLRLARAWVSRRGAAWPGPSACSGRKGRVFVLTGDGELQEGQNYEALQAAPNQGISALTVIVDHNKVQSDKPVREIMDLGDLAAKLGAFGWHVAACDGHDFDALRPPSRSWTHLGLGTPRLPRSSRGQSRDGASRSWSTLARCRTARDPIAGTRARPTTHPSRRRSSEILGRLADRCARAGLTPLQGEPVPAPEPVPAAGRGPAPALKQTAEFVADAYGEALVDVGGRRQDLVVLDADLAVDCRVRGFELRFPDRFVENGIAEQDMVSMAGGLARQGLLPVVNSFASFLVSRANEQIYNNATEGEQDHLRVPLRGPDSCRSRQVASEPARHLSSGRPPEHDDHSALQRRGRPGRPSSTPSTYPPRAARSDSRSAPLRAASSSHRTTVLLLDGVRRCARGETVSSSHMVRSCCTKRCAPLRSSQAQGSGCES